MRRAAIALTVVALVGFAANLAVAAPPHSGGSGHASVVLTAHHGHGPGHYGPDWGHHRGPSHYWGGVPRYRVVVPYSYYPPTYYGYPYYSYPYYGYPGAVIQYRGQGFGIAIGF
jgi:hypothetical protein